MDFDTFERLTSNLGVHSVGIAASLDGLAESPGKISEKMNRLFCQVSLFSVNALSCEIA